MIVNKGEKPLKKHLQKHLQNVSERYIIIFRRFSDNTSIKQPSKKRKKDLFVGKFLSDRKVFYV